MRTSLQHRDVQFRVEDGYLVRIVTAGAGDDRAYTHRCGKAAFETVAWAIAETPGQGEGTSLAAIARREHLPYTQVNVALEFMKERGLVQRRECNLVAKGFQALDQGTRQTLRLKLVQIVVPQLMVSSCLTDEGPPAPMFAGRQPSAALMLPNIGELSSNSCPSP